MENKRVWLSLGSNIHRQKYIQAALDALKKHFGELLISPVYETEAVGFEGDDFYNLVVGINSDQSLADISAICRQIEADNDRVRNNDKFSSRTLDIDILTWGDESGVVDGIELPRDEIVKYAFVLKPLVDVASEELHPVIKRSYQQLWDEFANKPSNMRQVSLF